MVGGLGRNGHREASRSAPVESGASRGTAPASLRALADRRIVVLPDLYIDALAFMPAWRTTRERLDAIARRGGGNLPIGPVEFKLGGNAANLALALARLGAQVDLIASTDELGRHLLERAARGTALRTRRVRVGARASVTLGLECDGANVMMSHAGPLSDFGPDQLAAEDWRLLEAADAVAFVNWSQNDQGTDLLRALSTRLDRRGVFLYVDTGDPRARLPGARRLLKDAAVWKGVRALGLNENELRAFTGDEPGDPLAAAQGLAQRLGTRLDLHTRRWAATVTPTSHVRVQAQTTPARRLTGAGDAWNAGNLAGHVLGWGDRERLLFAHEVATKYVTGIHGLPPTAKEVAVARPPTAT